MTTESMSGKHFLLKRSCLESVSRWTLLEELALIQIVQSSLTAGGSDIDIDVIAMQCNTHSLLITLEFIQSLKLKFLER